MEMRRRGRPPSGGRVRRAHLSAWVMPSTLDTLNQYSKSNSVPKREALETAINGLVRPNKGEPNESRD
jgi:hypothetical protein